MIFHPGATRKGQPLRILHCPWNIAGQSAQLAAAERALGADSRCIVIEETAQGFPADEALCAPKPSILQREVARWRLLFRAIAWADVVHFSFGQSCLMPNAFPGVAAGLRQGPLKLIWRLYCRAVWLKDLPLLSSMGKILAVTWQGDDARQYDRSLELFDISIARELGDSYYQAGSDPWKRRTIGVFARHAKIHYALNPDLLHVLPGNAVFLPYASFDPKSRSCTPPVPDGDAPLVFAHAPSHRGAKGTQYVLAAAQALQAEGFNLELRLIEGLPREEALTAYTSCDVMVDQLLAGWYGGLGVEAMALGKPVIAYLRDGDLGPLDPAMRTALPIFSATQDTIQDVMRRFLQMPRSQLHALGLSARSFVERFHDPHVIAARTLDDYRNAAKELRW